MTPHYSLRVLISLGLLLSLSACSTISYYTQSIRGQIDILVKRENIYDVIQDPDTPSALKQSLQQAVEIRQFASQHLHLPDNKSYLYYADLGRPYVVWNVFAAPEFSLQPKTWCYLIVGCVSYRGYFHEQDAVAMADRLKTQRFDVYVAGIAAYSTLGWFDDPLLNTMLHWKTRRLASLIFHELAHQVIYIAGDTSFNEAFATAVERIGTLQWLLATNPGEIEHYLQFLQVQNDFRGLLLHTRDALETLYRSDLSPDRKRQQKARIIQQLQIDYQAQKAQWPAGFNYDNWFKTPVNNARLTASMTYLQKVPAFFALFQENQGDWVRFFAAVKNMKHLTQDKRNTAVQKKLTDAPNIQQILMILKKHQKN